MSVEKAIIKITVICVAGILAGLAMMLGGIMFILEKVTR